MNKHQFQMNNGYWQCSVCQWSWEKQRRLPCPGVIRYEFGAWPPHLKTAGELSRLGMQMPSSPDGCYYQRLEPHWLWLYDERTALHLRPSVSKYATLLLETDEKCQMCGYERSELDDPHIVGGLCQVCRFEKNWIEQCNETHTWARASLHNSRAVVLNTENTGFEDDDEVIEIAVISATDGTTLYNTLVQTDHPIQETAAYRHHLRAHDLRFAPRFSSIWIDLLAVLEQTQTIICYNADFHRERLTWTAQRYGFTLPALEWQCLMKRYASFYGKLRKDDSTNSFQWQSLSDACKQQKVQAGRSPRSHALAKRARRLLQALAEKEGRQYE